MKAKIYLALFMVCSAIAFAQTNRISTNSVPKVATTNIVTKLMVLNALAGIDKQNTQLNKSIQTIQDNAAVSIKQWQLQVDAKQISYGKLADNEMALKNANKPTLDAIRLRIAQNNLAKFQLCQRYGVKPDATK